MASRIVVGYDGSGHARRALERAADFAAQHDSAVTVVSVSHILTPLGGGGPGSVRIDPAEIADHRDALAEARAFLAGRGIDARTIEGTGDPAEEILAVVENEQAGVVVVGTRGRGLVQRLVLGSVSSKVLQSAPCDVLVVR